MPVTLSLLNLRGTAKPGWKDSRRKAGPIPGLTDTVTTEPIINLHNRKRNLIELGVDMSTNHPVINPIEMVMSMNPIETNPIRFLKTNSGDTKPAVTNPRNTIQKKRRYLPIMALHPDVSIERKKSFLMFSINSVE